MAKLIPLYSSSSGNSVYISFGKHAVLVDCGTNAKRILMALSEHDIDPSTINAIFITHAHNDHISALSVLNKKLMLPIIASKDTLDYLCNNNIVNKDTKLIDVTSKKVDLGFVGAEFIPTSHDCKGSGGFKFYFGEKSVSVCTDLGVVTDSVRKSLIGSEVVYFESNHDLNMLTKGPYPPYLKQRIMSEHGHLSNTASASELPLLLQNGAQKFILGHLSKENNLPALAKSAATAALMNIGAKAGQDYMLYVAPPSNGRTVYF